MNLIDYFNAFHLRAQESGLSANARSLYFAILGEFNRFGYPKQLKLANSYLQHLSSINSTHSFDSARTALINGGFINYKKPFYELAGPVTDAKTKFIPGNSEENLKEKGGNFAEISGKELGNFLEIPESNTTMSSCTEKDKNKNNNNKKNNTRASNSSEVLQLWKDCRGEELICGKAYGMIELERNHGTQVILDAIKTASESNNYTEFPFVTYNFFKKILESHLKGEKINDIGRIRKDNGNARKIGGIGRSAGIGKNDELRAESWEGDTSWLA